MKDQFILPGNERLYERVRLRNEKFRLNPELVLPYFLRPCTVKVLLLTDSFLDFGESDFGLSTFVSVLQNDGRRYVKFEITLAHRSAGVSDSAVQKGATGIKESIKGFRFDNNAHFTTDKFDQIWLFGADSSSNYLNNEELRRISEFMNNGGGVFATGDHGSLGQGLCSAITRVRSMRLWNDATGRVGMSDSDRNDTNRPTYDSTSYFDDQSDDVPQKIQPKLYYNRISPLFRESYPHPLLCGTSGKIDVLPDHPHEGECIEPSDISLNYLDGSPEYPGGLRPEIIATSNVLSNVRSGNKAPTVAHTFGAISAYDGHQVGIGRVVTDATWHHFVNINLIGEIDDFEGNRGDDEHPSKLPGKGFLYSTEGQLHFNKIKEYYVNIGTWISRPENIECFNKKLIWELLFNHRVLEATMMDPKQLDAKFNIAELYVIGTHAFDVLGKKATQCRSLKLTIDLFKRINPDLANLIDHWSPIEKINPFPPIPWIDPRPLVYIAFAHGLIELKKAATLKNGDINIKIQKDVLDIFSKGLATGIEIASKQFNADLKINAKLFK